MVTVTKSRLLIVDDQMAIRMLLTETFRDEYHVEEAESGHQALEKLQTEQIHLILVDMKMPGLSGIETLQQIRAKGCQIPAILMTAFDAQEVMSEVKTLGTVAHISKPFDINKMRELVAQQLMQKII